MSSLPKVCVLSLGGTISMTSGSGTGVVPALNAQALVASVPGLAGVAEITASSFRQLPGAHLTMNDLLDLSRVISGRLHDGASGVVVTQGTDTIEETAFALDLLVDSDRPVVVTGAMRNPTMLGADGPANMLAAVQVAASNGARGLGTLVVFNDEIHAARFVQKTHSVSTAAFRSPSAGPLGWVVEGRVTIALRLPGRHHVDCQAGAPNRAVALLTVALGDDARLVGMVEQTGYAGLVVEAFGTGHVSPAWADALGKAASTMPVVLASRTGAGQLLRHTYGFTGSETDLLARGLISAGVLDGPKARILLTLLLMSGASREEVALRFAEWQGSND